MTDGQANRIDRFIRRLWIAFAVFVLAVGFAGWGWVRETNNRVKLGQHNICERLKIVRSNTNRNGLVLYEAIDATLAAPQSRPAREVLVRLRAIPRYQPQVDCEEVVERPTTYVVPGPVRIEQMSPAERQAILENGTDRANP